jgi:hypothetical protein
MPQYTREELGIEHCMAGVTVNQDPTQDNWTYVAQAACGDMETLKVVASNFVDARDGIQTLLVAKCVTCTTRNQ